MPIAAGFAATFMTATGFAATFMTATVFAGAAAMSTTTPVFTVA